MDDRRFDSLVKSFAGGANRRSVLKGILGLGGAALAGAALMESETDAARRPTPTPTPIRCPGRQVPVGGVCTCPGDAPNKCGPDCCTSTPDAPYPRPAGHSECCDNACCFGTCYGEELCCPTHSSGDGPPTHIICDGTCVAGTCCDDSECTGPCSSCDPQSHTCIVQCPDGGACCNGETCIPAGGCCDSDDCTGCQTCTDNVCVDNPQNCSGCSTCRDGACVADDSLCTPGNACNQLVGCFFQDGFGFECVYQVPSCSQYDAPCRRGACDRDTGCYPVPLSGIPCEIDGGPGTCDAGICEPDGN